MKNMETSEMAIITESEIPDNLKEEIFERLKKKDVSPSDLMYGYETYQVYELFSPSRRGKLLEAILEARKTIFATWVAKELPSLSEQLMKSVADDDFVAMKAIIENPQVPTAGKARLLRIRDDSGKSLVLIAASSKNERAIKLLKYLVETCGLSLNDCDSVHGMHPLHFAAEYGTPRIVRYILVQLPDSIELRCGAKGQTAVLHACQGGNEMTLLLLLEDWKASWHAVDHYLGSNAMHLAVSSGNIEIVKYLFHKNSRFITSLEKKTGRTPLLVAAVAGNRRIVEYFAEVHKAKFDIFDISGFNILHLAAKHGDSNLLEYIINKKPFWIDSRDQVTGKTPILMASSSGNLENLITLFERFRGSIDVTDKGLGSKAIHLAAQGGNPETLKYLLDRRPHWLEERETRTGRTPFLKSCEGGNLPNLITLVEKYQANIEVVDSVHKSNALHIAAYFGNLKVVRYLVKLKMHWIESKQPRTGRTPLLKASEAGNLDILQYLVEIVKAKVDVVDNVDGSTALHLASRYGSLETVKYLAELRPQWIEQRERQTGRTPLLLACAGGNLEIIKFLAEEKGADLGVRETTKDEYSCLHWAALQGYVSVIEYLMENKANLLNYKNSKGISAYDLAKANGHRNVTKILGEAMFTLAKKQNKRERKSSPESKPNAIVYLSMTPVSGTHDEGFEN